MYLSTRKCLMSLGLKNKCSLPFAGMVYTVVELVSTKYTFCSCLEDNQIENISNETM